MRFLGAADALALGCPCSVGSLMVPAVPGGVVPCPCEVVAAPSGALEEFVMLWFRFCLLPNLSRRAVGCQ